MKICRNAIIVLLSLALTILDTVPLFAQTSTEPTRVTLEAPASIDINYALPLATIGFNRQHILDELAHLRTQYYKLSATDSTAFSDAMAYLNSSGKKVIKLNKQRGSREQKALGYLLKNHIAIKLLQKGQAIVVRTNAPQPEKEIL